MEFLVDTHIHIQHKNADLDLRRCLKRKLTFENLECLTTRVQMGKSSIVALKTTTRHNDIPF